jgi:hypothetical protein
MKRLRKIHEKLKDLDKFDQYLVLAYVEMRWLRYRISQLRPRDVVVPTSIAQVIAFALCGLFAEQFLPTVMIWQLVIIGIGIYPMTLKQPRYHWVKRCR